MSQDVNTVSQQGSAVADDECFIRWWSEGKPLKDWGMVFIFHAISCLVGWMCYECWLRKALWLKLIEGDVDDDMWLWVDNNEESLASERPAWHSWYDRLLTEDDWVSASTLDCIVGKYWDGFSSETSAWENAIAKAKEDGCICSTTKCHVMQQWFNMIIWLEGKPAILEVDYKSCLVSYHVIALV
ncbi:hypothetical protein BKA82DRAFT_4018834 [Pisolithus tinctorius]|nr:hypothetical protein BKA82DRAFT_4018834 [Pisolithus tinctorius]